MSTNRRTFLGSLLATGGVAPILFIAAKPTMALEYVTAICPHCGSHLPWPESMRSSKPTTEPIEISCGWCQKWTGLARFWREQV